MALPNSTIELNLNMGLAPAGSPMIALLVVPPNVGRLVSTFVYTRATSLTLTCRPSMYFPAPSVIWETLEMVMRQRVH
jgi:hypothetical protein